MRLAVIAPAPHLEDFCEVDGGTVQLCLSQEARKSKEYTYFYSRGSERGDYTIMDNSAHEAGAGDSCDDLLRMIDALRPDEVVLPDRLFFGDDTYRRSMEAYEPIHSRFPEVRFMAVPQGRSPMEWFECLDRLSKNIPIHTIGISKDYEAWREPYLTGFNGLSTLVTAIPHTLQIHLLGWARDLYEPIRVEMDHPGRVRSIDSAKPIVYATGDVAVEAIQNGTSIHPLYPRRKPGFFTNSICSYQWGICHSNISIFRRSINDTTVQKGVQYALPYEQLV